MYTSDSTIGSDIETICELFAGGTSSSTYDELVRSCESPPQVPFYYLSLIHSGRSGHPQRLTPERVELGYRSILQRFPEDPAVVRHHVDRCANTSQFLASLLTSREAILRMPQLFTRAFPFARPLWHIHIPKTAGSSFFSAAIDSGWGYVNTNFLTGAVGDLSRVASAVRISPNPAGRTIISGHWHLLDYLDCIRPFDNLVVFVRDPVEFVVSEFNYAVDVVNGRPNVHSADPRAFLERGLDPKSFLRSYQQGFFLSNLQCSYLSADATYASATQNLARCATELIPSDAANDAISHYFPGVAHRRVNVSNKHVRPVSVSATLREAILSASNHDARLNEDAKLRFQAFQSSGARLQHPSVVSTAIASPLKGSA